MELTEQNEDLAMIRDQAQRFLTESVTAEHLKQLLEQPGSFDRTTWDSAVKLGWPAISAAEEHGGLGLGWRGICVLAEETGKHALSLPLIPSAAVAESLLSGLGGPAGATVGVSLVSGEAMSCMALSRSGDAGAAATPEMRYANGRLIGSTAVTPFAAVADYALITASIGAETGLFLVELGQIGVHREIVSAIDNSRAAAVIEFDAAEAILLADGSQAQDAIWQVLSLVALATAFAQIGGAQTCLNMARDYALERKAFGQQIGRFQAIKGKLADMYVRIEIARGCALDALIALERGDRRWPGLAAAARLAAIDAYEVAARENIQTHGAIGVTWEAMPHHHYRSSRALAVEIGSAMAWRERLLAEVGFDVAKTAPAILSKDGI